MRWPAVRDWLLVAFFWLATAAATWIAILGGGDPHAAMAWPFLALDYVLVPWMTYLVWDLHRTRNNR